ncbi:preprotein translocase subunit SecA, partial [Candidatus Parcubacteria bacterium]|nr:preprotein translocase subunit SecA [Candidatus Parcubacteria bacterium]
MKIFSKLFGDPNEKIIKSLQPIVDEINGLESRFEKMSDEELRGMTGKLKKRFEIACPPELGRRGNLKLEIRDSEKEKECKQNLNSQLDSILPEAFAVVREAAKRILGQRHYDVQLMGGIILHRGQITEMKTGEGKTLVATLPLYLNALAGKGVHLVTVNDYLSSIGAGWM